MFIRRMLGMMLAVLFAGAAFGQSNGTPGQTAKEFYRWYLHELNAERLPEKNKAKMNQFISARLVRWINSKAYEEYGADYFIDAQDFGHDWENNIQISRVIVTGASATLRVTLVQPKSGPTPYMGNKVLDLRLIKEQGVWKIDRVQGKH